jgi:hypothetical protein
LEEVTQRGSSMRSSGSPRPWPRRNVADGHRPLADQGSIETFRSVTFGVTSHLVRVTERSIDRRDATRGSRDFGDQHLIWLNISHLVLFTEISPPKGRTTNLRAHAWDDSLSFVWRAWAFSGSCSLLLAPSLVVLSQRVLVTSVHLESLMSLHPDERPLDLVSRRGHVRIERHALLSLHQDERPLDLSARIECIQWVARITKNHAAGAIITVRHRLVFVPPVTPRSAQFIGEGTRPAMFYFKGQRGNPRGWEAPRRSSR